RWKTAAQSDANEIEQFISGLDLVTAPEQHRICMDMPLEAFQAIASRTLSPGRHGRFIHIYTAMCEEASYGWSFAETIALNMAALFNSQNLTSEDKSSALNAAIVAAVRQNRFAAMDTCIAMIASIQEAGLAQRVYDLMTENPAYFMENIDPGTCRSPAIVQAVRVLRERAEIRQRASQNHFPS